MFEPRRFNYTNTNIIFKILKILKMIFVFKTFVILAVNTIDYFIVKQQVTLLNFF